MELLERDVDFRLPDAGTGLITGFDHYAYRMDDLAEAREFFTKTIGMTHVNDAAAGGEAGASFCTIGADVLGLLSAAEEEPDVFPYFALRVDDVDGALEMLAERAIHPAASATEFPSGDGRNAFLADPDGVRIELLER